MTWVSAASATACSADTSCEDTTMATGVAAGNDITAAAKAFSDAAASCGGTATDTTATPDCAAAFAAASDTLAASCPAGCTYTSKIAAKTAAYTTATIGSGTDTLQSLAQGTGTNDAGDDIDAYITSALGKTGIFADASCGGTATD